MRRLQDRAGAALTPLTRATGTLFGVSLLALAIDQATKAWALQALADGARRPLIGDLLGLRLIFNPGAAFSLGAGTTWIFTIVAVVVVIVLLRMAQRMTSLTWAISLALVLAGALGNLIDRLVRPPSFGNGHVIDFIDYGWFIGNVADIWIVVGAGLLLVLSITGTPLTAEPEPDPHVLPDEADTDPDRQEQTGE